MKMDRQAQFRAREALIFQVAEQLLLENGEAGMTLDALAAELDLAKGTLYKHFQSKDELYMLLIIRNEKMLLEMIKDTDKQFPEHLAFFMLHHLPKLFQAVPTQLNSLWLHEPWFQDLHKDVPRRYNPHRHAVPQFLPAQYDHQDQQRCS